MYDKVIHISKLAAILTMRETTIITLIFIAFLTACQGQNNKKTVVATKGSQSIKDTSFAPTDSTKFYFPIEPMRDKSFLLGIDSFVNTWYSKHLFVMREPLIYGDKSKNEVYRFTWLRTFHNPIAIRIEKMVTHILSIGNYAMAPEVINPAK